MLFKDIIGYHDLKTRLCKNVKEGKIPHALLLVGPEGSAALALAWALSTYILCENKQEDDSCGKCSACIKNKKILHPDLHFSFPFAAGKKEEHSNLFIKTWRDTLLEHPYLSQESWIQHLKIENKQLNINIEECHQIHAKLSMKPFEASVQILLMWLPEFLGKVGNSLLKLIEEPSQNTILLFVSENKDAILPTILSRMQLVKVGPFLDEEILSYLALHYPESKEKQSQVAFLADGNLEQAIRILSQNHESIFREVDHWLQIILEGNSGKIVAWVEQFTRGGKEGRGPEEKKHFLVAGMRMIRESILVYENVDRLLKLYERKTFGIWINSIHAKNVSEILNELDVAIYHVERNANAKILFLDVSLRLHMLMHRK